MATQYIGNNDYRGYLNYLAQNGDNYASSLLNIAGNDGKLSVSRIDNPTTADENRRATVYNKLNDINDNYYNYWVNQNLNPTADYDGTSASDAAAKRNAINAYNESITRTNNAIDDLAGSLQNRLAGIEGDYNTYKNEQQSTYNQQKNSYDNSTRQNLSDLVDNRKTITNNASKGLRNLMKILGSMGASNSSVALYNAPNMVKAQADVENNAANRTYAKNQQNLDTNWGNYLNSYENDKKKLEDWRTGQIKSAKQDTEKERINLLNQLSQYYADRAQYGEGYGDNLSQITNRINDANRTIRDLGTYTAPQYNGTTAVYNAPTLSSYDTGNMNISASAGDASNTGTSLLTTLQGLNKKKNNQFGVEA